MRCGHRGPCARRDAPDAPSDACGNFCRMPGSARPEGARHGGRCVATALATARGTRLAPALRLSLPGIREANAAVLPATHVVRAAETGEPCLAIAGVPLQSFTDPVADGRRWAIRALERLEGA